MEEYGKINDSIDELFRSLYSRIEKPPLIYHYTNQNSFLQMVTSGELWLSNIRHLNDPLESIFGIDVIQDILQKESGNGEIVNIISIINPIR